MVGNKLYKINWDDYLSSERARETNSTAGSGIDMRNSFESDLGRVIFCPAIRRMHDKTQVIPLSGGDTVLTRLTHSMQVMSVAESLASNYTRTKEFAKLYGDKAINHANDISAIIRTAALLHDIGNPPFGHFGEVSIQDYFKNLMGDQFDTFSKLSKEEQLDFTQFDGNAMGLRLISKLQYTGDLCGLNLTYGTMAAYLKYPNIHEKNDVYVGEHKHGIFQSEKDLFDKIVEKCHMKRPDGTIKRHPLSFLVEAADSICYGVMDIEDGFTQHWYTYDHLTSKLSQLAYDKMTDKVKKSERVRNSMKNNEFSIETFLGCKREHKDKTKMMDRRLILEFRVKLLSYLVKHTIDTFITNLSEIDSGTYNNELLDDDIYCINEAIGAFTKRYIISQPSVQTEEIKGQSVICGLLDKLIYYAFHTDKKYQAKVKGLLSEARLESAMHENIYKDEKYFDREQHSIADFGIGQLNDYYKFRLIVDFVACMTDKYSLFLYQKLRGISN